MRFLALSHLVTESQRRLRHTYGRPSCRSLFLTLSAGRDGPCIAGCNADGRYHAVDKYKTLSCHRERASCVCSIISYTTLQCYNHRREQA